MKTAALTLTALALSATPALSSGHDLMAHWPMPSVDHTIVEGVVSVSDPSTIGFLESRLIRQYPGGRWQVVAQKRIGFTAGFGTLYANASAPCNWGPFRRSRHLPRWRTVGVYGQATSEGFKTRRFRSTVIRSRCGS